MPNPPLPDPTGSPRPAGAEVAEALSALGAAIVKGTAFVAAGGVFLAIVGGALLPTRGATRSARLRWRERQQKAHEAVEQALRLEREAQTARGEVADETGDR